MFHIIDTYTDIARFDQYSIYHTLSDAKSIDHGDLGVEILKKNNYIRKFIENDKYDKIIYTAIKNHNKFKIEDNLEEDELLFCKIIKDADKLDIYYEASNVFYNKAEEIVDIENSIITDSILNQVKQEGLVRKQKNEKTIDRVIINLCFAFDINFKYSLCKIKENEYIDKIINRFDFKNIETNERMEQIRNIINNYIQKRMI